MELRPKWQNDFDQTTFIVATSVFFFVALLLAALLVQPLIYNELLNAYGGTASAAASPALKLNADYARSTKWLDLSVLGGIAGLLGAIVFKQVLLPLCRREGSSAGLQDSPSKRT